LKMIIGNPLSISKERNTLVDAERLISNLVKR